MQNLIRKAIVECIVGMLPTNTATVMTDEFKSYGILDKKDSQFQRFAINHKNGM
jgi:hypothetical protein